LALTGRLGRHCRGHAAVTLILAAALALLAIQSAGCGALDDLVSGQARMAGHSVALVAADSVAAPVPTETPTPSATPTAAPTATTTSTPTVPTATATVPTRPTDTPTPRATSTPRSIPPGVTPAPFFGGITTSGNPKTRVVALTFDSESASVGKLGDMLDAFRQRDMQATFFVLGIWAERNPQWVRRIVDEGHEIGTHSHTHPDLTKLGDAQVLAELGRSVEAIERASAGRRMPRLLRPPFGAANRRTLDIAAKQGYETIKWNVDPEDWRDSTPAESIVRTVGQKAQPGDIVVMHLHVSKTAESMPAILDALQARGLRSGTISQVLGRKP